MQSQLSTFYSLTGEQRELIIPAIYEGLNKFEDQFVTLSKLKTNKNFLSRLRSAFVNTSISEVVDKNPHLNMRAAEGKSGFYYYTLLTDLKRNINILVSNLPNKTYIFNPSAYRNYFASSNVERMFADGFDHDQIGKNVDISNSQMLLFTDTEYLPFGLVLCYDGNLGKNTKIFEGALQPSQEEWLFKLDVTNFHNLPNTITTVKRATNNNLELEFKKDVFKIDDEIIPLRLK